VTTKSKTKPFQDAELVSTFSQNLRKLAEERCLTQDNIATELNVSPAMVNRYWNGRILPSVPKLIELSRLFECQVDDLIVRKK